MLVVCVHAGDRMPVDGANVHSPVLQIFHQRTLMLVVSVHAGDRMPVDGRMFIHLCFKISISALNAGR